MFFVDVFVLIRFFCWVFVGALAGEVYGYISNNFKSVLPSLEWFVNGRIQGGLFIHTQESFTI